MQAGFVCVGCLWNFAGDFYFKGLPSRENFGHDLGQISDAQKTSLVHTVYMFKLEISMLEVYVPWSAPLMFISLLRAVTHHYNCLRKKSEQKCARKERGLFDLSQFPTMTTYCQSRIWYQCQQRNINSYTGCRSRLHSTSGALQKRKWAKRR